MCREFANVPFYLGLGNVLWDNDKGSPVLAEL